MPEVVFDWTGQNTEEDSQKVQIGELVELTNVRRTKLGQLTKRLGYDRSLWTSFVGGTFAGPVTSAEFADCRLVRDSSDQLWALNESAAGARTGYYRGKAPRASYTYRNYEAGGSVNRKPVTVLRSTSELWHFTSDLVTGNRIFVTVTDPTTGAVIAKTTAHTMSGNVYSMDACVDSSGNMWLFHTNGSNLIYAAKWAAGVLGTTSPTITTYVNIAGRHWTTVSCKLLTAGPESGWVVVYADRFSYGPGGGSDTYGHHVSRLNTATGVPSAAVEVTATQSDAFNAVTEGGSLFGDGTGGVIYVAAWKPDPAGDESALLQLFTISTNALTVSSTVTLTTLSTASIGLNTDDFVGVAGGYVAGSGDRVVYASWVLGEQGSSGVTSDTEIARQTIVRYTYNGTSTTSKTISNSAWLASRPFQVGSNWYFLSGFDDGEDNFGNSQKGYFLRNADGLIIADIANSQGYCTYHGGGLLHDIVGDYALTDGHSIRRFGSHLITIPVSGTKAYATILFQGSAARSTYPVCVDLDFAARYDSRALNVIAGGVLGWTSEKDTFRELSPIHFPHRDITFTNGGGALIGTQRIAYLYATIDSNNEIVRSAPRIHDVTFNANAFGNNFDLLVPCYHHAQGPAWVEIYTSAAGASDLYLQYVVANQPLAATVTVKHFALSSHVTELLYTTGDALDNGPAPSARVVVQHKGRLFAFGTPNGRVFFTKQKQQGRGWEWNGILQIDWPDRSGAEWWACQISPEILAFGDGVKIGIISGPGPDGNGSGAFQVVTLNADKTPNDPRLVTRGPLGCYFLKRGDNRPCVLTAAGVTEIGKGFENYREFTFTGARYLEGTDGSKGQVVFVGSSGAAGKIVKLDCDRPFNDQQAGQWLLEENSNLNPWIGANLVDGVLTLYDAGDSTTAIAWKQGTGFTDNGTIVLKKWKTGKYQLGGFLGEFDADWFHFSSERLSTGSTYQYSVFDDQGSLELHTDTDDSISDVGFRSGKTRTRWIELWVTETAGTGRGRLFNGCAIEFKPYRRMANHRRTIA